MLKYVDALHTVVKLSSITLTSTTTSMFAIIAVSKGDVVGVEHLFTAESKDHVLTYIGMKWDTNSDMLPMMQENIERSQVNTPSKLRKQLEDFNSRALSYSIVKCDFPVVHVDNIVLPSDTVSDEEGHDDEDMHDPEGDVDTEPGSPQSFCDEDVHYDGGDCACLECIQKDVGAKSFIADLVELNDELDRFTGEVASTIEKKRQVLAHIPCSELPTCPPPLDQSSHDQLSHWHEDQSPPTAQLRPAKYGARYDLRTRSVQAVPPHLLRARRTPLRTQRYAVRYVDGVEVDVNVVSDFIVRNRIRSNFAGSDLFAWYDVFQRQVAILYEVEDGTKDSMDLADMERLQQHVCSLSSYVSRV